MKTTLRLLAGLLLLGDGARAASVTFGTGLNQFAIEFVAIGDAGNAADTTGNPNPAGAVSYDYSMGKHEISRDMITKANAEGNLGITLSDMTSFGGNGANPPATGITWYEAATFVNWLNTSQGHPAAYKFTSVGGTFQLWNSGDAGFDPANRYRNSLATYWLPSVDEWTHWLPSVDEWHKAAYYDPS